MLHAHLELLSSRGFLEVLGVLEVHSLYRVALEDQDLQGHQYLLGYLYNLVVQVFPGLLYH